MCLILLALNPNNRFRLVVVANRDEYYARPTRTAAFWPEDPNLLAGMDENMGGAWLGDGYYGLSNQLLDCDWPKVIAGRQRIDSHSTVTTAPDNIPETRLVHFIINEVLDQVGVIHIQGGIQETLDVAHIQVSECMLDRQQAGGIH